MRHPWSRARRLLTAGIAVLIVAGAATAIGIHAATSGPSATLVIHVIDSAGHPITGSDGPVVVSIDGGRAQGPYYSFSSSATRTLGAGWVGPLAGGVATFRNLPPHIDWSVVVKAGHAYSPGKSDATVPFLQTRSINVTLTRGATVSGRVTLPGSGQPAPGVLVGAIDPASGHVSHTITTKADGTYQLAGLATGTYLVKFNISKFGDAAAGGTYGWTLAAHPITVHAQTAHSEATIVTGMDATLALGHTLTVINHTTKANPQLLYIRGGPGNNNETAFHNGVATGALPPGNFYLMVVIYEATTNDFVDYWYAGNGKPVVLHKTDGVPVNLTGDETVTIG